MTPDCKKNGCHMFAPATHERAVCMSNCRLQQTQKRPGKKPLLGALLLTTLLGRGK